MPQQDDISVSVIIVAYQSGRHLARCLDALERQTRRDFEVILVDNASTDGALDRLPPLSAPLRIIRNARNLGFAAANNQGAELARGRWLATLNPDAFALADWLERFAEARARYPGIALFGSTQLLMRDPRLLDGAGDPYHVLGVAWRGDHLRPVDPRLADGEVFGPCGAAAFYDRAAFREAGGFEPSFFCYYEDVDLAFRLRLLGHRCIQLAAARVLHVGGGSDTGDRSFVVGLVTRNILWTVLRNMPWPLLAPLLPVLVAMNGGRLALSALRGDFRTRLDALCAALADLPDVRAARRHIQSSRRIGTWAVARALTWSPVKLIGRRADLRSVDRYIRYPAPVVAPREGRGVAAVIVTYGPDALLDAAIAALAGQVERVWIIDNGSGRETEAHLRALAADDPRIVPVLNGANLGLAAAQNIGLARALDAGFDWVLLLDQDSVPGPAMVPAMLAAWRAHPEAARIGLVAPRIHDDAGTVTGRMVAGNGRSGLRLRRMEPGTRHDDILFAIASGSLVRAAALRDAGLMRADYFIDYVDIEFCLRLRRAGWRILALGDAGLRHRYGEPLHHRLTPGGIVIATHDAQRRYTIARNRVRTWRIHGSTFPAWVAYELAAVAKDLARLVIEPDRLAKLKAILRGFRDGVRA